MSLVSLVFVRRSALAQKPVTTLYGFTPRSSAAERRLEYRFLSLPTAAKAREAHALLTAEPHVAGSPRDRALAEWVRDRWRRYGLEQVEIVEHEVLLPGNSDRGAGGNDLPVSMARDDERGRD